MKGASLYVESLQQSLWYCVPYGIGRNPHKLLKALLNQKAMIACIHLRVEHAKKEIRPSSLTANLFNGLHLKSKKLPISMHIYTFKSDK